ncbi:hypothetical protein [Micromonospora sp. NBC_01813]|uniref:hypothetical protein n=1 Tax=Micromonospora sp. NBC_01813 TaxID=2975988 RepID=UPI002DDB4F4C|nr:hypothetical protein [Micromonospora sp. NBC_01813]WSA09303.1 hypothetical protein OG958_00230 [Micromonospora sp. NBC_01813]
MRASDVELVADCEGEEFQPPIYARALRLRHVQPSGLACLVFFEGSFVVGVPLALAELIPWWGIFVLPVAVAIMVKINDFVAGVVERSAELVPEREQELFRREVVPAVGRSPRPVVGDHPGIGRPTAASAPAAGFGPGIRIRHLGGAHPTATATTRAALAAPTVLLEALQIDPSTTAALGAPTVLLEVVQVGSAGSGKQGVGGS